MKIFTGPRARVGPRSIAVQRGLTMVELLVALTLSGLIALAAIASLTVARRGFTTVDAASQLRDNARFATDLIQRVATQAGYQDFERANQTKSSEIRIAGAGGTENPPPPFVQGWNNMLAVTSDPRTGRTRNMTNGSCPSTDPSACLNGSDILILRYQTQPLAQTSTVSDNAMVDCMGQAVAAIPGATDFRNFSVISVFHVQQHLGEPTLMCARGTSTAFPIAASSAAASMPSEPIVQGVESFQVLYGLSIQPATAPASRVASDNGRYDLPERYMTASEVAALALPSGVTDANHWWRQVRSLRIALLVRGPANVNQDRASQSFAMLMADNTADPGSLMQFTDGISPSPSVNNANFIFAQDGRPRQVSTFTVYLRNDQAPLDQR